MIRSLRVFTPLATTSDTIFCDDPPTELPQGRDSISSSAATGVIVAVVVIALIPVIVVVVLIVATAVIWKKSRSKKMR